MDIVTTISGVGNVLKFRHLAKLSLLQKVIKLGGYIEASSGTINALLKLTDLKDKPWAQDLQEVLFFMELLSLGAEATNFIKNRLKKAAGNVLKYEDDLIEAATKEGIEDVDGFVDELYEVAELDYLAKWDDLPVRRKGYLGGKTLRRKEIKFWTEEVTKISKGKSKLVVLRKKHPKLKGNQAGFDPFDGNIYVQKGLTEYEIFHEYKHLE